MCSFKNLSCLILALVFISCVQQDFVDSVDVELYTTLSEDPSTKSIIDESDPNSLEVDILWGLKESIGVYGRNMLNSEFKSTNKWSKVKTPIFSGTLIGSPQYAYYPYSRINNGKSYNEIAGNLPQCQSYSTTVKKMKTDYKIAKYTNRSLLGYSFEFSHIMSFVRFNINADNTPMSGESIRSITMTVYASDGSPRLLCGDFTMDISRNASEAITSWNVHADESNSITLNWEDSPVLKVGKAVRGYLSAAPEVCKGDLIKCKIITDNHCAILSFEATQPYKPGQLINYDINLYNSAEISELSNTKPEEDIEDDDIESVVPILTSFKFEVSTNPDKILSKQVYYDSNTKTTKYREDISEISCEIDQENKVVKAYIPYLYNRKLIPTYEVPEGMMLITAKGELVYSGITEVDFTQINQLGVATEKGELSIYNIVLENTGLPVVVVNQKSGIVTSDNGDYKGGSTAWYNATGTGWQPKDSDWLMVEGDDNFMVYNADGTSAITDKNGATVNEPLLASTRVRGNVSQKMPKKPFAVKLDKKSGIFMNDSDQSNDLPAHKRWVLLANWSDRTLMRNAIAFGIADIFKQTFPTDGIAWNPSGQFVELVYNGVHVGNYYLCEHIKIDGNRLDIADPYDKDDAYSGNAADYGYLLESDDGYDETVKFITKTYIPFQFKDDADAGGKMLAYAKGIVNGIDDNLYAGNYSEAYKTMDLTSFVDFLLIQELTMNGELAHPKSCHSYIEDGKLYAGPVWDFDWQTFPNINIINQYYDNAYTGGYNTYKYEYAKSMLETGTLKHSDSEPTSVNEDDKSYMWYPMLVKDATFKNVAAERWNMVKGAISAYADTQIPVMAAKIRKSETENWSMWPLESGSRAGQNRWSTYDVGGGFKGDEAMTFDNAVSTLTNNLNTRINGMSYVTNKSWPTINASSSGGGSSWWPW